MIFLIDSVTKQCQACIYNPNLGKFVQPDTLTPSGPQGLNRYSYVGNNPLRYNDPSGHMPQRPCVDDGLWCGEVGTSGGGSYTPPGNDYDPPSSSGGGSNGNNGSNQPGGAPEDLEGDFGPTGNNWRNWACGVCVPDLDLLPPELVGEPDTLQLVILSVFSEPLDWVITTSECNEAGGCGLIVYAVMLLPGAIGQSSKILRNVDEFTGQWHHIFTTKMMRALDSHPTLRGVFQRESILVQAVDLSSHNGYDAWHRSYDQVVLDWLSGNEAASPTGFLEFLIDYYSQPSMVESFPLAVDGLNLMLDYFK